MSTNENIPLLDNSPSGRRMAACPSPLVEPSEPGWVVAGEPTQATGIATANLISYLHGLRRHWVLATVLGLVCGLSLAMAVWFGWAPQYAPSAFLRVARTSETIIFETADKERFTLQAYSIYKDTQRQLVTSPFVLDAALNRPEITPFPGVKEANIHDPVDWLQKKLRVTFPGDAEIMQVSVKGEDREETTALVNAVVATYMDKVVLAEIQLRRARLSELDSIYIAKDAMVRAKENDLRAMAISLGADEPEALAMKQRMAMQELGDYQRQLSQITFELNRANAGRQLQQALLDNVDNMEVSQLELDKWALADPVIRQMSEVLAEKQLARSYTDSVIRPGATSRYATQYADDMFRVQAQLDEMSGNLREGILRMKRSEIGQELQRYEIEVAVFSVQQQALAVDVEKKRREMTAMSGSFINLEMGRTQIRELNGVLAEIAKEREALAIEVEARPRVSIVGDPKVKPPKSSVNRSARMALSVAVMIVGLCIPGGFLAWWDVRLQRINSSDDVSKGLGLTVIGSMPLIPTRVLRQLGTSPERHQAWHMRLTEAVDGTVARLLRKAEMEQARVILVTSPTGGEGTTTLATQLALSLTRNGRRTVLVDFDLRQPALDQAFELPLEPGISEVLRGESALADVIQPTGTDNLSVVAAGRWDRQVLAALANGGAGPIFDSLREEAEFVVIDASAILPVADTRFVSQHVDTVLLSIFRDVSQIHKIEAACEILEAFGVSDPEAVVTCPTDNLHG